MSLTLKEPPQTHAPRREKRREANWLAQVESAQGAALGRTANVSLGGLLVLTSHTFKPKTEVTVRFHLRMPPDNHFIESRGRVVHEEPGDRMGIQFLQLQGTARLALREFIYGAD
ncbi:MAG: PilZ domain-containing protein [Candidatus Acidiferrales bacterium]